MKKAFALILALLMLVSLCACAGQEPADQPQTTDPTSAPTDPSTPADPTDPSDPSDPSDPTDPDDPGDFPVPPEELPWDEQFEIITIAQALELCGEEGNETEERYYLCGTIVSIDNANYGAMTIEDETGSISVYGTYSSDGSINYSEMTDKPFKGDKVLLHCILQNFKGTKEVKNARLIDFEVVEQEIDESDYTQMTIAQARDAEKGAKVKTTGVVARITYSFGMIPSGFFLIDDTQSIYVYDSELAARVKDGNRITILAEKDYWILDSEQANAQKYGYKGCNQLTNGTLVDNDNGAHEFQSSSWIASTTIKAIMDTPVTEDITTTVYKVTGLVKKAPGNGFTNYYLDDLDGTTGSYVYTQCNGNDFAWLDAFDGKICTIYMAVINAKSTASGCVYRFIPILVQDEKFDVSTVNPAQFAVEYFGLGQFMSEYTGDPAAELLTAVSSDLLGFEGVQLSYASSDESVLTVSDNVLHCLKSGIASVTVTATYGDKTFSADVQIVVAIPDAPVGGYGTVADAIAAPVGEVVTVKGIVAGSVVNKKGGFYLIDETGVIAVLTDTDTIATIKPGQEVVMEGTRHINTKNKGDYHGQTCIIDAKLVVNNYGEHAYSENTFVTDKTLADFYNLDVTVDYSTTVFVVKAKVVVETTSYYTKIYLADGDTQITLYSSGAQQYSWLNAYSGQEITVELAACNWNDKSFYAGCVLAVVNGDGTKTVNELNFQN